MTISTIDPATPLDSDPAGQGDDQIRTLKQAIVDQFAGQAGDLYDIPVTAGPRSLNAVDSKADQADLDAIDARVTVNEGNIGTLQTESTDYESRISAIEADYTTAAQAGALAWPVGSLFISADGGTPTSKGLPGTWSVVGDGRMLMGDPVTGTEAGSNSVTLVEGNLPEHKHTSVSYREDAGTTAASTPAYVFTNPARAFSSFKSGRDASSAEWAEWNTDGGVNLTGSPSAVDVTNAHLTVRFYRRTA